MKMFYRSFFSIMKKYNNSERYGGMRHANGRYSFYVLLRFTRVADDPGISVILWRNGKKQKWQFYDIRLYIYKRSLSK